jgi:hypothetical protein
MGDTIGGSASRALALRLGRSWLCFFTLVIIVLININVTCSRLVMLRALGTLLRAFGTLSTLLLRRLRHARQWWLSCHGWQGRRVVSSL